MPMVRKQVYLTKELDEKVKLIARSQGVAEAEVIRDALDAIDRIATVDDASDPAPAQAEAGHIRRQRLGGQLRSGAGRKTLELARKHALENAGAEQRVRTWTREDLYDE